MFTVGEPPINALIELFAMNACPVCVLLQLAYKLVASLVLLVGSSRDGPASEHDFSHCYKINIFTTDHCHHSNQH